MLFPVLLATVLLLDTPAQEQAGPAAPTATEAVQLANEGRDAEALAAFQQRAAARPDDHDARLWIARLHERLGHRGLAEPVYRSVLLEDPANLEARLGVAATLVARDAPDEAVEVLEVAEERESQNPDVLILLARAHRRAGRTARAIGYFERVVAVEPSAEHQLQLEDARLAHEHRFETRGFSEQFGGGTPDSRSGDATVNYRLNDTWRVIGRGQVQRKFAASEQRGGGGVEWRWKPRTTVRGQVLVGPGNLVMPEGDYLGELEHMRGPAIWTGSVRYFDFTGARTTVFSPAVSWLASERWSFAARYAMSWTETSTVQALEVGQSAHLRGAYRLYSRMWVHTGYAAGVEDFENFSIDRIGNFHANTVLGGVRFDLPTLTTVIGNYEHLWRSGNVDMGRVTVSLQQRF